MSARLLASFSMYARVRILCSRSSRKQKCVRSAIASLATPFRQTDLSPITIPVSPFPLRQLMPAIPVKPTDLPRVADHLEVGEPLDVDRGLFLARRAEGAFLAAEDRAVHEADSIGC